MTSNYLITYYFLFPKKNIIFYIFLQKYIIFYI